LMVDILRGQNFIGEDLDFTDELASRMTPLYLQDAYDAARQEGILKGVVR